MKSLTPLPAKPSYLERYILIRDKKHKKTRTPLTLAHTLIEARYKAYAKAVEENDLVSLKTNTDALKISDALRACYDVATQPLKEMKKAIKENQPKRQLKYCPMCGTTLPKTFDHYMPAVRFPEFAVHPHNLVPCCSRCNSTKDDDWLNAKGERQYFHAYADTVPDVQFVEVALVENPATKRVGAKFNLQRPAGVKDHQWRLVDSHYSRLKLIELFDEHGNDEVTEILADCFTHLETGGGDARTFLTGRAKDRTRIYGRNHWIVVLMTALSQHPNLDQWIQNR